jgi:hypothetical protein
VVARIWKRKDITNSRGFARIWAMLELTDAFIVSRVVKAHALQAPAPGSDMEVEF